MDIHAGLMAEMLHQRNEQGACFDALEVAKAFFDAHSVTFDLDAYLSAKSTTEAAFDPVNLD